MCTFGRPQIQKTPSIQNPQFQDLQCLYGVLDGLSLEGQRIWGVYQVHPQRWLRKRGPRIRVPLLSYFNVWEYIGKRIRRYEKDEYTCTCCTKDSSEYNSTTSEKKYFHSQEYNAGRHSSTQSKHKLNCLRWSPPNTGHLHSWRRGFTDSGKE